MADGKIFSLEPFFRCFRLSARARLIAESLLFRVLGISSRLPRIATQLAIVGELLMCFSYFNTLHPRFFMIRRRWRSSSCNYKLTKQAVPSVALLITFAFALSLPPPTRPRYLWWESDICWFHTHIVLRLKNATKSICQAMATIAALLLIPSRIWNAKLKWKLFFYFLSFIPVLEQANMLAYSSDHRGHWKLSRTPLPFSRCPQNIINWRLFFIACSLFCVFFAAAAAAASFYSFFHFGAIRTKHSVEKSFFKSKRNVFLWFLWKHLETMKVSGLPEYLLSRRKKYLRDDDDGRGWSLNH